MKDQNDLLTQQLKVARAALEFYSDPDNLMVKIHPEHPQLTTEGGFKARNALKALADLHEEFRAGKSVMIAPNCVEVP